ncbi:putative Arc-like DNA binding domain [Brevibacillus phage Osiris]|uniref:Arc-like DNA binding domain n=3 Tax=Caudoviricetes TaxID=2731619 RepID=S5M6B5_9CAUD|nr:Arc-like repressor [Brevibacillus phage Davies]YP_009215076.1 Arc-like repressor [Brevibacillus phage Osiris]AGR47581.2 Arc-like DNA binding domain [Brevibacillus phage Davies]ALA07325.1 putative Arc-like DNA binding domain [Brevibacillus phage Osiris]ALA48072.1 Arc-like DNA binding domain [Brevibacillus phage Powder]
MKSNEKRFTLRMDADLFERIKEQAEKNKRSVAKEIEFLIEKHLEEVESIKIKIDE